MGKNGLGKANNGYPAFDFGQIRMAVRDGDLGRVSTLSYSIAAHVWSGLSLTMERLEADREELGSSLIDSPSGFSAQSDRTRACDREGWAAFRIEEGPISPFQMSPSLLSETRIATNGVG